ncbi:hypothetical protein HFO56_23450 [Rhizobium laguerreae]|uniref:secretion/conjugation apparatus DotM-related subunit n=1 Tax=Rhizobium laguerreae TaxID=1076926 RepID=UPI001C90AB98|nr:hypothetical protein [Rhizobium laguerreae]MBY3155282.1 hypothetical protein [Rhizobium laguerreae]
MAGKGQQGDGSGNIEMVWFIAAVLVILGAWCVWTYAKSAIVYPGFAVDYAIIWIIEHTKGLGEGGTNIKNFIEMFFDGRKQPDNPKDINWETFAYVRKTVGQQVSWFIAAAIVGMAIAIKYRMKGEGYKTPFSLAGGKGKGPSFAKFQAENWRVATYSANFDPDDRDAEIGPPLTPPEWLKKNAIRFEENELDHDACRAVFTEQLGKQWHGFDRATLYGKAVLLMCALHYLKLEKVYPGFNGDKPKNISLHEREELSIAWASGKDGTAAMKSFVERHEKDPKVRKVIDTIGSKHAYENTVIYAMLDRARAKGGVFKEHDMAYIKKLDRNMWYGMNNCGRKRFHTEGAGIMSHYFAERISNRALIEPYLDPACEGVENYLYEEGIESLDLFFTATDEHAY